jgi:hypothetical protein
MFRNKLKYYHGTSIKRWEKIKSEKKFIPSHIKKVCDYWITKGIYFVCENPYIALWYAHVAALQDKSEPIVLCLEYEADKAKKGDVLNLLTSDGQKLLAFAHHLYSEKLEISTEKNSDLEDTQNGNLDSVALQLMLKNSKSLKAVIASFQEGNSYQTIIHNHDYKNKFIPSQKGFSPGDHVEICFYPNFEFEDFQLAELSKDSIVDQTDPLCIWNHVCEGLTEPLENGNFKTKLKKSLSNKKS